jgi:hypothetical protein
MTLQNKIETGVITFGRARRWLVTAFGLFVAIKGILNHDWLSSGLGMAIIAYGMLAPT